MLQTNTIHTYIVHELTQGKSMTTISHYLLAARKLSQYIENIVFSRRWCIMDEAIHPCTLSLADWQVGGCKPDILFTFRYGILTPNITSTFAPPAMERYREGFFEYLCPLCQQDVDILQPDSYRALPLNPERIAIFSERPTPDGPERYQNSLNTCSLKFRDFTVGGQITNVHKYTDKIWLLHNRCLSFVDYLPPRKLHLLLDLVEPTWTSRSNPPKSQHGAFYAHSRPIFHDSNSEPALTVSRKRRRRPIFQRALGFLCQCIMPQIEDEDGRRPSLPAEIWDLVLQDDLARLLFIMKAASQIANLDFLFRPQCRAIIPWT